MKVENAIIMAAGASARFAPLSYERHKALTVVKGEVLIERQIRQLLDAGIPEVYVITGYKAEQFDYLIPKYGVRLLHNPDFLTRNNNSSIWVARHVLGNSYLCSSDNYFTENPFRDEEDHAYYAAEYADGPTNEWCMTEDAAGNIDSVTIGGENAWYMMGHTFWSRVFTERFLSVLAEEYDCPVTADKLWEKIFMDHLDVLKMKIEKFAPGVIYEFDTLNELRAFDQSYIANTRSKILHKIAEELDCAEAEITDLMAFKTIDTTAAGFRFRVRGQAYSYDYGTREIQTYKEKST